MYRQIGAAETRTPEPTLTIPQKVMANSASTNTSLYEKLYKHQRHHQGLGHRFNNSAKQVRNDEIKEAEEDLDEDKDESEDDDDENADSNEEDSDE